MTDEPQLCQCLVCGRMHPAMPFTGFPRTEDEQRIKAIAERVRATIGPTFKTSITTPGGGFSGPYHEGRISKEDFDALMNSWMAWKAVAACSKAWDSATPEEQRKIHQQVADEFMADHFAVVDLLKEIVAADDEFRAQLMPDTEIDPLTELCQKAKALIAKIEG